MNAELLVILTDLKKKKKEVVKLLDHIKSPYARKDRYRQLTRINQEIERLEKQLYDSRS